MKATTDARGHPPTCPVCEAEGDASIERAPSPEADGQMWWRCAVCEATFTVLVQRSPPESDANGLGRTGINGRSPEGVEFTHRN